TPAQPIQSGPSDLEASQPEVGQPEVGEPETGQTETGQGGLGQGGLGQGGRGDLDEERPEGADAGYETAPAWQPEEETGRPAPTGEIAPARVADSKADEIESAVQEVRAVTSTSEASSAAARLLEIASNNAEELMGQA